MEQQLKTIEESIAKILKAHSEIREATRGWWTNDFERLKALGAFPMAEFADGVRRRLRWLEIIDAAKAKLTDEEREAIFTPHQPAL